MLWGQLYGLVLLATNPEMGLEGLDIELLWRTAARTFATNFCILYESEDVTPYLHQLVYHAGFYLKTCGSLEKLANFAIEGKHRQNKRTVHSASSGHSRKNILKNLSYQQIARTTRQEIIDNLPKRRANRKKINWKDSGLKDSAYLNSILTAVADAVQRMTN
jgi:hypothetical protein